MVLFILIVYNTLIKKKHQNQNYYYHYTSIFQQSEFVYINIYKYYLHQTQQYDIKKVNKIIKNKQTVKQDQIK